MPTPQGARAKAGAVLRAPAGPGFQRAVGCYSQEEALGVSPQKRFLHWPIGVRASSPSHLCAAAQGLSRSLVCSEYGRLLSTLCHDRSHREVSH